VQYPNHMDEALYYNALALEWRGVREAMAKLRAAFGTWKAAYTATAGAAGPALNPEHEFERLQKRNIRLVLQSDAEYPPLLREIAQPPFGLYIRGTIPDRKISIAVVGTRKATSEGKHTAREFGRSLSDAGVLVVSGLAFGIDAAAHEGALDANAPTVAVIASGLHAPYPRSHERLAEKIAASGGAVVSEYPFGEPARPFRFLERNRIVSGLATGAVIIEAPDGSGALNTARHAFEENRDLFVVPGSIRHPNFKGSHALIRQGAELVRGPEDICEAYGITKAARIAYIDSNATPEEKLILKALSDASLALTVDKLTNITKLDTRVINRALALLIIKNLARETEGGYIMN